MPASVTLSQTYSGPHVRYLLRQPGSIFYELPVSSPETCPAAASKRLPPQLSSSSRHTWSTFNHHLAAVSLGQLKSSSLSVPQVLPCQIYLQCFSLFLHVVSMSSVEIGSLPPSAKLALCQHINSILMVKVPEFLCFIYDYCTSQC